MNRTLWKDTLRLIRHQKGRYLSFVLIVLIGTAFYTGVTASSTMMAQNVDAYNDSLNLKDITIYSNLGFDEDDIAAIQELSDVKFVEGAKFADVMASDGTTTAVTRIHSLSSESKINQFLLVEGRLPENDTEVLAEAGSEMEPGYSVGSVLTLSRPDNDLDDWITIDTVTVVGSVDTPLYLNMTKENSTLSNQYIDTYLYLNESVFVSEYDTEVNVVTMDGASFNSFYQPYMNYMANVTAEIESLAETQSDHHRQQIVDGAMEQYEDGYKEYEDALATFHEEIANAEQQIQDGWKQIEEGRQQIEDAQTQIDEGYQELEEKRTSAQAEINAGWVKYRQGLKQYQQGLQEYEENKTTLSKNLDDIDDGILQIDKAIPQFKEILNGYQQIDDGIQQIDETLSLLDTTSSAVSTLLDTFPVVSDVTIEELKQFLQQLEAYKPEEDTAETIQEYLDGLDAEEIESYLNSLAEEDLPEFLQTLLQAAKNAVQQIPQLQKTFDTLKNNDFSLVNWLDENTLDQLGLTEQSTIQELSESLSDLQEDLTETRSSLIEQRQAIEDKLAEQGLTIADVESKIDDLTTQRQELVDAQNQIYSGLSSGKAELDAAETTLQTSLTELRTAQTTLNQSIAAARRELEEGEAELESSRKTLEENEAELLTAEQELVIQRADGAQQLEDAKAELDKALQDIENLENCTWTVLDRSKHYASETFKNTVQQMKAIADVFPVFFLLVASLVCLTTMTRMVAEERGQLGIMRALGYTQLQCAFRYLFYSGTAALLGCILGSALGMITFPVIIYQAWKMMYILPPMKIYISWQVIFLASGAFFTVILLTTWLTCSKDMREVPSQLLRPKSPKLGKATLIERIDVIWSHLSFTWKVTIRNLLRYKKRLIMTLIGVAGCTALLVTGFGIKNSIQSMVDLQFEELQHYEGSAVFEDELTQSECMILLDQIRERDDVAYAEPVTGYSTQLQFNNEEETANMLVFTDTVTLETMFTLRTRNGHEPLTLNDDGVIISEKLSENMGLSIGDTVTVESVQGVTRSVPVIGICEMYIQHYVFMSATCYTNTFGTAPGYNEILILESESADNALLQTDLLSIDGINSISFIDSILENFQSMVDSLDLIVWVLIISSMSLAFVVLGNLTNINISERQREIATLKVLGFRRKEVRSYIFNEGNILTLLGGLVGLPVGNYLHHYIMRQVEMDYIMFGRSILPESFVYSVILTVLFGLLVNFFMRKRLTSVQMAESLKSVE